MTENPVNGLTGLGGGPEGVGSPWSSSIGSWVDSSDTRLRGRRRTMTGWCTRGSSVSFDVDSLPPTLGTTVH